MGRRTEKGVWLPCRCLLDLINSICSGQVRGIEGVLVYDVVVFQICAYEVVIPSPLSTRGSYFKTSS